MDGRWSWSRLRPSEALAASALVGAGVLWLLALPSALASGWAWAMALGAGAGMFALALPPLLWALVRWRSQVSRLLLTVLAGSLACLGLTVGLTALLVTLDVL